MNMLDQPQEGKSYIRLEAFTLILSTGVNHNFFEENAGIAKYLFLHFMKFIHYYESLTVLVSILLSVND